MSFSNKIIIQVEYKWRLHDKAIIVGSVAHLDFHKRRNHFLADRTIGRAFGTMCRLSVVCRRRL